MAFIDFNYLWLAFIGIFAIVNPSSTALVFLAITSKDNDARRKFMEKSCNN